jgi:hypothetical protein
MPNCINLCSKSEVTTQKELVAVNGAMQVLSCELNTKLGSYANATESLNLQHN